MSVNLYGFSDAARRLSDAANQAIINGDRDRWMAFALADGSVPGSFDRPETYPTRRDAIRSRGANERNFGYIKVPWDMVTPRGAEVFLRLHRQLRDSGMQLTDPEQADRDYATDNRREAMPSLDRRRLLTGSRISPGGIHLP